MQLFRSLVLLTLAFAVSSAPVLQRTVWEKTGNGPAKRRTADAQTQGPASILDTSLANINAVANGKVGASDLFEALINKALTMDQGFDSANVQKLFSQVAILRQTPAYKEAVANGADLTSDDVAKSVLQGALQQFSAFTTNMYKFTETNMNGGINTKIADFIAADPARVDLANLAKTGDQDALQTLKEDFAAQMLPGFNVTEEAASVNLEAKRASLAKNSFLQDALSSGGSKGGQQILSTLSSPAVNFNPATMAAFEQFVKENF